MAYPTFIGKRYLRTKSRASISVISGIAVAGVALGVASLLVVVSVTSGFQEEFTKKILGVNAHVLVMKYGVYFTEYRDVMETCEEMPEVVGVSPFVYQDMMISKGSTTRGAQIKGIDPERIGTVLDLPNHIVEGGLEGLRIKRYGPGGLDLKAETVEEPEGIVEIVEPDPELEEAPAETEALKRPPGEIPGIILGKTLAVELGAKIGDQVQLTTPTAGLTSLGWSADEYTPQVEHFKVVGLFYAGFYEYDTRLAYVDYYQVQRFFKYGDSVQGVEVTVRDIRDAERVALEIRAKLGGPPYHTTDWETLNHHLYTALMIQKVVLMVIVALLVGVSAFNIIATLVMMVFDKRREIAILKSMGATKAGIALIFLHVGTVVGLVGIAIGLAVGLGVCTLLIEVGWPLDPKVYLIDHLPVRINVMDFVITSAVAFVLCLAATLLPSLSAASLRPVDGIRHQ